MRRDRSWRRWRVAALVPPVFIGAMVATHWLLQRQFLPRAWVVCTLAGAMTVTVAGLFVMHVHWHRPLRKLERLLTLVRADELRIEELASVKGDLRGLAGQLFELMSELKQQRAQHAQTDREMRQRLAQRTDALERLVGSLRHQANKDPLTGLHNRRGFDQHLAALIEHAQKACSDACILMLDLDNFKVLNDTLGHDAGDEFLRSVGQIIRSAIRDSDLAFRYGGDEFVLLLPETPRRGGELLARRLVSLVDALGRTYKLPRQPGLSAGVAALSEVPQPQVEAFLKQADSRLYADKRTRKAGQAKAA